MSENKSATLVESNKAIEQNFSTDNKISGGCTECGCEVLIYYHYDSGKPVPNAPFVLTDSNEKKIEGRTDANGLCFVHDMGCGLFELLMEEGSDEFTPKQTVANNPVLQSNPEYARIAGEYFTLFLILRKQGLIEYDADDSSDSEVDVDESGIFGNLFTSIPDEYRKAYTRFWELDRKINRSSPDLKRAVNKIHHSLAAEVADKGNDNAALLLFCEIALGFIPVVGQAMDVYAIGEWGYHSYETPALLSDNLHIADGALCVIGIIPGLGDALKVAGRAIIKALRKSDAKSIQFAIKTIRNLSDGNLIKGLTSMRSSIREYGAKAKKLLQDIHAALVKVIAESAAKGNWIVSLMKESFDAMVKAMGDLIKKFDQALAEIDSKFNEFIGKVITRFTASSKTKGSYKVKGPDGKPQAMAPQNAGRNADEAADNTAAKQRAAEQDQKTKQCTSKCDTEGEPVDMATGAVVDWRTDIALGGLFPLAMKRYYRSAGERHPGLLGRLWRSNWDISLTLEKGLVRMMDGEFNEVWYALPNEGEILKAESNPVWRLTRSNGVLTMMHLDGMRYQFEHALGNQLCLTAMEDRAGNRATFLWERTWLRWIALPDSRLIHVETRHHRVTALTLCDAARHPLKKLVSYQYNDSGDLTGVRADEGHSFDYRYSPEGWLLRWNDLAHTWVEHTYDKQGRALSDNCAGGYWSGRFSYDDDNLTNHYRSGFGGVISYIRDERNNILVRRTPDGGEEKREWVNNQLVAQIDPLGNRTEFTRNDWGQIVEVKRPDGAVYRYDYDEQGQLLGWIDPLGNAWRYTRNALGQVESARDPEGCAWHYAWNEQGLLAAATAPDGSVQRYVYDRRGLLERLVPDRAPPASFFYDSQDRMTERHIAHESGTQIRRWEYHGSRTTPATVIYEDGTSTRFSYDIEGNLTAVQDALGQTHLLRYGAFDNLLEATDPLGATVRYHYNAEAEFAGVTNSQGKTWSYRFDTCGRLCEEKHYDGRVYRYEYDLAGQLTRRYAPDGSTQVYQYDVAGQLTQIAALRANGDSEGITTFGYDLAGRLIKAAGPDALVEYRWSPAGHIVSESINGAEVRSGYDEAGQRAVVEGLLASLGLSWQHGRLATLSIGEHQPLLFNHNAQGYEQQRSNGQGFALRHEWTPTGLLTRQKLETDGGQVSDTLERRYQYDALDRLTGISDSHWGDQAFRLNGTGQITAERRDKNRERQARLFGYDSEQNLCDVASVAPGATRQDAITETAQYDVAGRIIRRGDSVYQYDDCGRLVMKRRTPAGFRPQETRYEWNVHDRLVRIQLPDGARWRYRYDPFGRRVSKVREGNVPSAQSVARIDYRWDGDQLVGQQHYLADGSAARQLQWVYEPGSFRPLAQLDAQGERSQLHYIVTDLTGTARELCSEEGEVHWRGEQQLWAGYREARKPMALRRYLGDAANEETSCDLRYPGQLYDAESGLYYNRHRYYDPEAVQYISPDPIGLAGGIRPQGYVHNPLEWVDPLGLVGCPEPKKNKKTTYNGASRRDAFREAKRDAGIPMNQQPTSITKPELLDGNGKTIIGSNGQPMTTRQYEFIDDKGRSVFIQEHSLGHSKATIGHGAEPHFNVRPPHNLKTGDVHGTHGHYNF